MNELTHNLLDDAKSICLLVNETNKRAQSFYRKCGFRFCATYETIFLLGRSSPVINEALAPRSALIEGITALTLVSNVLDVRHLLAP